jgi:hypothetical protein
LFSTGARIGDLQLTEQGSLTPWSSPMLDYFPFPPSNFSTLMTIAHHIDRNALLYLAAATVARFWHEHMWMVYVAMAYTTILGLHH